MGAKWQWEIPVGLEPVSRRLHEASDYEVVVSLRGPGVSYYRRFSPIEGDAIQFHIESFRQVPIDAGNEGRTSPMLVENHLCNLPVLTRSNVGSLGVGWDGNGSTTQETSGSCDRVPSDCDLFFGKWGGEEWLMELCDEISN
jgi:hypothetical protein